MKSNVATFQDWCIDTLVLIINSKKNYCGVLEDQGYKYTIKSIISHYASMCHVENNAIKLPHGKQHINLWWDHLRKDNFERFFSPLLLSEKATEVIERGFQGDLKKDLRIEHITPNGYIYDKFKRLVNGRRKIERAEIADLFKQSKLVVLKKEESDNVLDGKEIKFERKDVDLLQTYYPNEQALIAEGYRLVEQGRSPKSDGSGLLRLCRLYSNDIRFVYNRQLIGPDGFSNYLTDASYEIKVGGL